MRKNRYGFTPMYYWTMLYYHWSFAVG